MSPDDVTIPGRLAEWAVYLAVGVGVHYERPPALPEGVQEVQEPRLQEPPHIQRPLPMHTHHSGRHQLFGMEVGQNLHRQQIEKGGFPRTGAVPVSGKPPSQGSDR